MTFRSRHLAASYSCGVDEPRAVSAEEPDGENLHVRIWRGPGLGDWPRLLYTTLRLVQFSRTYLYLTERPGLLSFIPLRIEARFTLRFIG